MKIRTYDRALLTVEKEADAKGYPIDQLPQYIMLCCIVTEADFYGKPIEITPDEFYKILWQIAEEIRK